MSQNTGAASSSVALSLTALGRVAKRALGYIARPIDPERRVRNAARFEELPPHLKTVDQVMGRWHHACGATHGVYERCNFACTSCYLTSEANAVPPLPPAQVYGQLDELRAFLGPQGKAQITAGEVTLLPVDVLGDYVAYALRIGLDPMVMSHGQTFLDDPPYLERLVATYGLRKISIHVDVTQRGRRGWKPGTQERDWHPLRDRYARLIRHVRRKTGRALYAASTVTVTEANLSGVADVIDWVASNADAVRMISFQPVAAVGRTQDPTGAPSLETVWTEVCRGFGRSDLNPHPFLYGHPSCNAVVPLVVVDVGRRRHVIELARSDRAWDRAFLGRLFQAAGGFTTIGEPPWTSVAKLFGLALRSPRLLLEMPFYGLYRLWGERRWLPRLLLGALTLRRIRMRPLAVVVHDFMSPEQLDTPEGQERLQACVFQVPIEGEMVPMCTLNATDLRLRVNRKLRMELSPDKGAPQAASVRKEPAESERVEKVRA
ncbi:MAG: hypothetical protein AAF772_09855 [Acidobacteriota bacterium]